MFVNTGVLIDQMVLNTTRTLCVCCVCVMTHTDVRDKLNRTPLHYACSGGSLQVVQYLVDVLKVHVGECIMFKLCILIRQNNFELGSESSE